MTQGSIPKTLTSLTIPMMLGMISMVAFNLVDTYFVGKLGKTQLAALSFTFPVIMVIFSLMQGLGIGATALISKSIGKNDREKAARETTDSLVLSLVISGFFIVIGLFTVKPTFELLGAGTDILPYVSEYMTIWYFALFFVITPFIGNSAIRATGDAKTPSLIMIFAVIINAVLDPLLIFGYEPFPAMGLKGAALATAISRGMTMILSIWVLVVREKLLVTKIPTWRVISSCWKAILFIGLPSGFSKMVIPLATGVVTALLAMHGDEAVAAFGVGSRIEFLAMSLLFALSFSIGPFTGQNFGAGKFDRITSALKYANQFSIIWGLLMATILFFVARPLAAVFTEDSAVIEHTVLYLQIIPIAFGLQGIVQNVNSNLNTLNKPIEASVIIIFQMLIFGIPVLYFGSKWYGIPGIFMALSITYIVGGLISIVLNKKYVSKISKGFSNAD